MTEWPRASVVIPTFRRPEAVRRCLGALARLDYPRDRLEVVVVDDGGGGLVQGDLALAAPAVTIRLVRLETNGGPARARNHGARNATGAVIAFTDDDCCPRPAWLRELVAALVAEPAALVGGRVENALVGNRFAQASQDLVAYLYEYFPRGRALKAFFTSNNVACTSVDFLRLGGFDESFRYSAAEDRDLSERWAGPLRPVDRAVVDHHHPLTFWRFLRQHHYYGRGACHLGFLRRQRGQKFPLPEPLSFYWGMLQYPVRVHGWRRGGSIAALVALSQAATVMGMARELVNRGISRRSASSVGSSGS
jgi:glycosyltransferase involved in cell wall biosynthesis